MLVGTMAEEALLSASPSAAVASSAFASASAAAASESLAEELEQKRALLPRSTEPRPPLSVPMTLSSGDLSSSAAATAGAAANRAGKIAAAAAAARSMGDEGGSALDSRVLKVADFFASFFVLRCFGLERKKERKARERTYQTLLKPLIFNFVLAIPQKLPRMSSRTSDLGVVGI